MGQNKKKSSKSRSKRPINKKEVQNEKARNPKEVEVETLNAKGDVDVKSLETPSQCVDKSNGQIDHNKVIETPNIFIENNNQETLNEEPIKEAKEITVEDIETKNEVIEASVEESIPIVETPTVETPTVETPTVETPTVETPTVETPTVFESNKPLSEQFIDTTIYLKKQSTKDNLATSKENLITTKQVEVPYIPEIIKHPLENMWGFWLFTNENRKNWAENQKELTMFETVEDYWCLYHHMKLPSELKNGQDYAVFKRGISPMWEDSANRIGGRWVINIDRKDLDNVWGDVVLLLIGENFENSKFICGAVVNVRTKSRVCIWTRNKEEFANMEIGRKLKEMLRIHNKLQFLDHKNNSVLFHA